MDILKIILGALGTVAALLIGKKLVGGSRPAAPPLSDQARARATERLAEAARTGAARAAQRREAADDQAVAEVGSRPHTDDAVADLRARLGKGPNPNPRTDRSRPD